MRRLILLAVLVLLLSSATFSQIAAQETATCGTLIEDALDLTNANCGKLSRNQICYGNVVLSAEPQEGITDFNFDEPGDIVPVAAVRTITLSSILEDAAAWGIAQMRLQANLPDTLPGQNVTFLLFGDVEMTDASKAGIKAEATSEAEATADAVPLMTMQAFYFTSSVGNLVCNEAPESGILVQTPQGAGQINLVANEVNITLGSTAYLQAQPSGDMTISVVDGQGEISAFNTTVIVREGYRTTIPLDANGLASAAPSEAEPYDPAALANLPIRILPLAITIATPEATDEPPSGSGAVVPLGGEYELIMGEVTQEGCPAGSELLDALGMTPGGSFRLRGEPFDVPILMNTAFPDWSSHRGSSLSNPEPGTYVLEFIEDDNEFYYEAKVIDGEHMEGVLRSSGQGCTANITFTVTRIGD